VGINPTALLPDAGQQFFFKMHKKVDKKKGFQK
jgi:hypothetical protein